MTNTINNAHITQRAPFHTFFRNLLLTSFLGATLFASNLSASVINGNQWIIKSGDSLYKIARTIYPESAKKRAQLRKALMSKNPEIFKNGAGNISVGDTLQLPDFAIQTLPAIVATPVVKQSVKQPATTKHPTPAESSVENSRASPVTAPVVDTLPAPSPITTPDPQDIVGQVIINIGSLTAQNRGSTRELQRRSSIYRGDTLATSGRSYTQIRLKDGALLSLRPHTNIRIAEFHYNGTEDGSERSVIELLKGGFRTITGAIGHINKRNYQVRTSVATIGIRGTHYSLILCEDSSCNSEGEEVDDGLYGGVADGSITLENKTGIHTFNNDQFFHLTSQNTKPFETLLPPQILRHGASKSAKTNSKQQSKQAPNKKAKSQPRRLAVIFEANQPSPVKRRLNIPRDKKAPPLTGFQPTLAPNGSAVLIGFNETTRSLVSGVATPIIISNKNDTVIVLGKERTPIAISETTFDPELGQYFTSSFVAATANGTPIGVPSDLGRDTKLGVNWGRWNGDFTIKSDGAIINGDKNLHFIYSENITSPDQLANLEGIKSTTSYTSTGGTLPTDNQGFTGVDFANITLTANFITQSIDNYNVSASIIDDTGNKQIYSAGIISPIYFTDLNNGFYIDSTAGCAGAACTGEASVLFIGPNATGAISSYQINNNLLDTSITGTAVLSETVLGEITPQ